MEAADILQEIPDTQLPKLQNLFKKHWPTAIHAYFYLDNYIEWKNKSATSIKFFCPKGRWDDDGTFIAIDNHLTLTIFAFTLEKSCSSLNNALRKTKRIDWSKPNAKVFFLTVHEALYPTILDFIREKNMTVEEDKSNLWWISREDALKYEYSIPDEVYVAPLKKEDVKVINPIWPHKSSSSEIYLTTLIELNGGFGLYSKKDNSLCSWVMRNNYGGLGILQTLDEHKRKGYGFIMAKLFSKYWAENGLDIFCFIMITNTASPQLFKKLEYKKAHGITWITASTQ